MQKIIRIARLELSVLFYSPIAWIIMVIIFVQCGLNYMDTLYMQETQQQLERKLTVVTRVLFAGENGMLSFLIEYLYLYIPLLTMGIFSREYTSGSIKLLQSSPVTTGQIVLGKYLSVVAYAALIILLLCSYVISAYISVEYADVKFVFFGLLGLFLLICTYAAIGLFMSSLTAYQVVAAISTLALLALLNYAPTLGAGVNGIREITYWLSVGGRAEEIVNGLLTSRELVYFILIIGFFLTITVVRMEHQRSATVWWKRWGQYIGLSTILIAVGYWSSLPTFNFYYDTTQIQDRTLSASGQEIAKRINAPIKMTSFVNVVEGSAGFGSPKNRIGDIKRFEKYSRFIPQLEMEYIVYYDTIPYLRLDSGETLQDKAKKSSEALGFSFRNIKTPAEIRSFPQVAQEDNVFVRFIDYKGKQTALRMYNDIIQYPGEAEMSAALMRLLEAPALIGVLHSKGERSFKTHSDSDYRIFLNGHQVRNSVINQGFEVLEVALDTLDSFNGACLIISDPQEPYSPEELNTIYQYIDRGGNLFLLADPSSTKHLAGIAEKLGLRFREGTLLQESEDFDVDLLKLQFDENAKERGFSFYDGATVVMNGASGLEVVDSSKFEISTILATNPSDTWNRIEPFDLAKEKITFDIQTDSYIQIPTALQLERKVGDHIQKIMVTGDADFMSNAEMNRFNINDVNASFAMRIFKWFSDGKYPVSGPRDKAPDVVIKVDRQHINMQKIVFLGIMPFVLTALALYILRKRRNQ